MADATVGRVLVSLGVDSKPLQDGAKKAEKALEHLGQTVEGVSKEAAGDFDRVESAVKDVARTIDAQSERMTAGFDQVSKSITDLSAALRKAQDQVPKLADPINKTSRSLSDMGKSMSSIGTKMSLAITAPMVATGAAAIKLANDFEFAMASIAGLVGVPQQEVERMSGTVRDMAKQFGASAPEAAKALYFVASAGISAANSMNVVEASLKASAIGMGQTQIIADAVSSALNAYGEANLSASEATDLLVASVRRGKMEADTLAAALPRVLPIASAMGVSFQEVGAAFAAMSLNGTDANEAATQIRGILSALLNPTKQAEDQLTALGLSGAMLRKTIRDDGLLAGLELLTQAFGNNEEAAGVVFGNIRALTGIMSLFGEATAGTKDIFADLTDNTGEVDKAFRVMSETGAFKMSQAVASLKDAMIGLGQALGPVVLPALKTVANALAGLANGFNAMPKPIKTMLVVLAGIATVAGPLLVGLGAIARAIDVLKVKMVAFQAATPWVLALTAAVTVAMTAFTLFANAARDARERQERLTDAMRTAGEPTAVLTAKVRSLVDEYKNLSEQSDTVPKTFDDVASSFLYAESLTMGITDELEMLGISFDDLGKTVATGTNSFDDLNTSLVSLSSDNLAKTGAEAVNVLNALKNAPADIRPFTDAMYEAVLSGEMTGQQLAFLTEDIHKVSNAFDDNREAIDAEAKSLLTSADTLEYYSSILGTSYTQSVVSSGLAEAEAAGRTDQWTFALERLQAAAENQTARNAALLDGLAGLADVLGVDVANASAGAQRRFEDLADVMGRLRDESEEGKVTFESFAGELGILDDVMRNRLAISIDDLTSKNSDLVSQFSDSAQSSLDLERAYRDQADMIAEAMYNTAQYGGSVDDIAPTLAAMVIQLGEQARAAGFSDERIAQLIQRLGILDGLEAKFGIKFALNAEDLDAQIARIEQAMGNMIWAAGGGGDAWAKLSETLEMLKAIRDAVGDTNRAVGSGGGGGGGRKKEDPFAWVDKWLENIARFVKDLLDKDFADRLIRMSADDIGDAIADVLERALELGVDKLDPSGTLVPYVNKLSAALQGMATRLSAPGGLQDQFDEASAKVQDFESDLRSLEQALSDFRRVEVQGQLNANELLAQGLDKYSQLKSDLQGLRNEYAQFTAGPTALESQLSTLNSISDALANLRDSLADVEGMTAGLSPLERERKTLDELKASLDAVRTARTDYQRTTEQTLAGFKVTTGRGGPIAQAKAYLAKAQQFREIIGTLRDREFPPSIIRDVIAAGLQGGVALGRKLLALTDADLSDLKAVQAQISQVAAETAQVAADVLFTADVSAAESAFDRQLSLVKAAYAQAIAQSEAQFAAQKAIVEGVYQQQIANAEALLEQQKAVVQGLYENAITQAKANLAEAKAVADQLKASIDTLTQSMRDLITAIAKAIEDASKGQAPGGGGGGGGGGGSVFTPAAPGSEYVESPIGNFIRQPGQDWTLVHRTPFGDYLEPTPGNFVPVDLGSLVGRAAGGPVAPRNPYLVGEVGPELFVPNTSGTIVPTNALGMGGDNTYNITVNARGDATEVGRQVVRAIQEYERRNGKGWRS